MAKNFKQIEELISKEINSFFEKNRASRNLDIFLDFMKNQ